MNCTALFVQPKDQPLLTWENPEQVGRPRNPASSDVSPAVVVQPPTIPGPSSLPFRKHALTHGAGGGDSLWRTSGVKLQNKELCSEGFFHDR